LDAAEDDPFLRELAEKSLQSAVEHAESFAAWVAVRRTPSRCLKCGNTGVTLPNSDWSDLPHPPCGGRLRCTATLVGGTFARVSPHRYSSEGELVEVGKRNMFGGDGAPLELWGDVRPPSGER
jgi:hypothetical protein